MYDREINQTYFERKLKKYFRFVFTWSAIISIAVFVKERDFVFLNVFIGALHGKGRLFHLWFITTLVLILGLNCLLNCIKRKSFFQYDILFVVVLMNILFIINTYSYLKFNIEIRNIVPAPFRLITNGGFYLLGMYVHSEKIKCKDIYLQIAFAVGTIGVYLYSIMFSMPWASTFYSSIFCIISTLSILVFCLQKKVTNNLFWWFVRFASPTSIGIWVLHPFARNFFRRILEFTGIEMTLSIRIIMIPIVFISCMTITKVALKIKGLQLLFRI